MPENSTDVRDQSAKEYQLRPPRLELDSADPIDHVDSLKIMVDAVVDYAFFILDTRGYIRTWNTGAERIKGYSREEILGEHFSVFYPAEAILAGLPELELTGAARDGRSEDEGWRLRKDGSRIWANVVITALRSAEGELIGFGKVTRDFTARRIAEESLRDSHRFTSEVSANLAQSNATLLRILDASIFSAIMATDLNGTFTTFNRGAELMLGYSADEVIGKLNASILYVADEIDQRMAAVSKLVGHPIESRVDMFLIFQEQQGPTEWTFVHKDGHHITVALSASIVSDESGRRIGAMGVARDVSRSRTAAQELSAAHARLNSALEYTSDSIMTIGTDWTILYGNGRAKRMIRDLTIGRNYWLCFPDIAGTPIEQTLRTAMVSRKETNYEIFYEPYSKWFRGRIFPNESGITIFFSDITEEKNMAEKLAQEQLLREKRIEALSHMAGGLAHEISNPLAIIHARASDLKSLAAGPNALSLTEVQKVCDSIIKTSERATRILNGLQGFGREAGQDPMEPASVNMIVEQCRELQAARYRRHKIQLDFRIAPNLRLVLCREVQIGQIVTNLLNNAFDAIDQAKCKDRWVSLTAEQVGNTVCVNVTDSGPGIEEQFRPHLMEPFFTTKAIGMGVGLSLSRAIANDHGGSLQLLPDTEHTCFQLVLPIRTDAS